MLPVDALPIKFRLKKKEGSDLGAELNPGSLTSGHHDVCQPHGRLDVLLKGRLDELVVLFDDAFDVPAALCDVSAEAPHQPYV